MLVRWDLARLMTDMMVVYNTCHAERIFLWYRTIWPTLASFAMHLVILTDNMTCIHDLLLGISN